MPVPKLIQNYRDAQLKAWADLVTAAKAQPELYGGATRAFIDSVLVRLEADKAVALVKGLPIGWASNPSLTWQADPTVPGIAQATQSVMLTQQWGGDFVPGLLESPTAVTQWINTRLGMQLAQPPAVLFRALHGEVSKPATDNTWIWVVAGVGAAAVAVGLWLNSR